MSFVHAPITSNTPQFIPRFWVGCPPVVHGLLAVLEPSGGPGTSRGDRSGGGKERQNCFCGTSSGRQTTGNRAWIHLRESSFRAPAGPPEGSRTTPGRRPSVSRNVRNCSPRGPRTGSWTSGAGPTAFSRGPVEIGESSRSGRRASSRGPRCHPRWPSSGSFDGPDDGRDRGSRGRRPGVLRGRAQARPGLRRDRRRGPGAETPRQQRDNRGTGAEPVSGRPPGTRAGAGISPGTSAAGRSRRERTVGHRPNRIRSGGIGRPQIVSLDVGWPRMTSSTGFSPAVYEGGLFAAVYRGLARMYHYGMRKKNSRFFGDDGTGDFGR